MSNTGRWRKQDSQRVKVYKWERQNLPYHQSTLGVHKAQELVTKMYLWWFRLSPKTHGASYGSDGVSGPHYYYWSRYEKRKEERPIHYRPHDILVPKVMFTKRRSETRCCVNGVRDMKLSLVAENEFYICHEVAHGIVHAMRCENVDGWHGPYFMRVYMELLGRFTDMDRGTLIKSAKSQKIKIHPIYKIPRPKLNETLPMAWKRINAGEHSIRKIEQQITADWKNKQKEKKLAKQQKPAETLQSLLGKMMSV